MDEQPVEPLPLAAFTRFSFCVNLYFKKRIAVTGRDELSVDPLHNAKIEGSKPDLRPQVGAHRRDTRIVYVFRPVIVVILGTGDHEFYRAGGKPAV